MTLLIGHQKSFQLLKLSDEVLASLSGVGCKWFACGPDAGTVLLPPIIYCFIKI